MPRPRWPFLPFSKVDLYQVMDYTRLELAKRVLENCLGTLSGRAAYPELSVRIGNDGKRTRRFH